MERRRQWTLGSGCGPTWATRSAARAGRWPRPTGSAGPASTLSEISLEAGLWAAELAALPLLELMTEVGSAADDGDGWDQLASLERVEVYQATGMIIGHLDVDASEALVRLRAYAFSRGLTASEAAWVIVERRVSLTEDESFRVGPGDSDRGPT